MDGFVIWFTGLSGAGKSTIAVTLKEKLEKLGRRVKILDGDEVRNGISWDLGFSKEDRDANIARISYVAKSIADVGGVAISAVISPYREAREKARALIGNERFVLVYINTPLEKCEERDVKGLYKKARNGQLSGFTGIDDPYEEPINDFLSIDTSDKTVEECVKEIIDHVETFTDVNK